jgi:hypothetical protein
MPPLISNTSRRKRRPIGVGEGGVPLLNPPPSKIIIMQQQFRRPIPIRRDNPKRVKQGMKLNEIKASPRLQKPSHNLPPGHKVRQVTKRPLTGINDVKPPPIKNVNRVINIRPHILNGNPTPPGNVTSVHNRLTRDVQPHSPSPPPSKSKGLHPKVTLQVQQINT